MTRSILPVGSMSLAARIANTSPDITSTSTTSAPLRADNSKSLDSNGLDPKGADHKSADHKSAGTGASSSGGSARRVEPDLQFAAEVRGDLRPRDPFRPPLPNPSPDAAIAGEARIGIRAKPSDRVTLNVYGRVAAKGQLTDQRAEYFVGGGGAAATFRLSPRTDVTAGAERLHIFGPPSPRGPLDFKATDVTVSAKHTLTSKPAAPGHPSVDVTMAFV